MIKDYYKILDVPVAASDLEIKKAYRDLSFQLHPDKNKANDAHNQFVELNEAFQILSSTESRKKYDQLYFQNLRSSPASNTSCEKEFEPIRNKAHRTGEKVANMDFHLFITEFLTEIMGSSLVTGMVDGVSNAIKGTGEILGDVISNIDL